MKAFITSVILTMAAGIASVHAGDCKPADAAPVVAKLFEATRSENCEVELKAQNADAFWINECRRALRSMIAPLNLEFFRRTKTTFKSVETKDGHDYAIVDVTGPDQMEFQMATMGATVEGNCVVKNTLIAGMNERICGEEFWRKIPIKTRPGAVPIICEKGAWRLGGDPNAEAKP